MIRIFSLKGLNCLRVFLIFLEMYMQPETEQATVKSYDPRTGTAVLVNEAHGELEVFLPLFFGGRFAPYPKLGDRLNIQVDSIGRFNKRVVEAWHPEEMSA
jgi:hypothetical protein